MAFTDGCARCNELEADYQRLEHLLLRARFLAVVASSDTKSEAYLSAKESADRVRRDAMTTLEEWERHRRSHSVRVAGAGV